MQSCKVCIFCVKFLTYVAKIVDLVMITHTKAYKTYKNLARQNDENRFKYTQRANISSRLIGMFLWVKLV